MAKKTLAPEKLRSLIDTEREDVLATLRKPGADDAKARDKEARRQAALRRKVRRELLRGKGILSMVAMAEAVGWTRQLAHRTIAEAEAEENGRPGDPNEPTERETD